MNINNRTTWLAWLLVAIIGSANNPVAMALEASSTSTVPLDETVYIYLETGTVVVQLAPFIAPNHVNQFKALVKEGFYDGLDFYLVIDGFVAE